MECKKKVDTDNRRVKAWAGGMCSWERSMEERDIYNAFNDKDFKNNNNKVYLQVFSDHQYLDHLPLPLPIASTLQNRYMDPYFLSHLQFKS